MKIISVDEIKKNSTEWIVGELINKFPEFFASHSIQDVSKEFNVSPSTMTRVCKKLGFKSFKSIQMYVYEKSRLEIDYYKIADSANIEQIVHNVKGNALFTINETLNNLIIDKIEEIALKIYNSNKMIVFGIEQQETSAKAFISNLLKIDINATRVNNIHTLVQRTMFFNENDFAVFITRTGWTKEVIEGIKWVNNMNVPSLVLTTDEITTKKLIGGDEIDWKNIHIIETQTLKTPNINYPIISSLPGELIIFDVIFNAIISLKPESIDKIKKSNEISLNWNFEGHL